MASVGQHERILVVGTPELVWFSAVRQCGAADLVPPPLPAPAQAVAIEHRMHGADRRALRIRVQASQPFADLRCAPMVELSLETDDSFLDLHRQLVGMPVRPLGPIVDRPIQSRRMSTKLSSLNCGKRGQILNHINHLEPYDPRDDSPDPARFYHPLPFKKKISQILTSQSAPEYNL